MILVSPERAARLVAALSGSARIHHLASWTELRNAPVFLPDAVVVDPLACDGPPSALNQALCAIAGTASLIVYTSVTPMAMRRMLDLPILAGAKLILAGLDDGPDALRMTFGAMRSATHYRHAVDELRTRSGPLPLDVKEALADLLRGAEGRLTVDGLARAARMSPRTLERRLAEAHAPPPFWLIKTARAVLARELLGSSPLTVLEVARRVGYARVSSLRALLRWSFDSPPSLLRQGGVGARTSGPHWRSAVNPGPVGDRDGGSTR